MFTDTINKSAANAARIARLSANNPLGFWVSSAMAAAYVGLGIILIFTLGNLLDPSVRPLVMGATFGIALTLVIIAGSELFTRLNTNIQMKTVMNRLGRVRAVLLK